MLHVVVYLIHQGVPIRDIPATLLKVRRLNNVLEKHRVEMKGIIRAPHGYQILRTIILGQSDEKVKSIDKETNKITNLPFLPQQRGEKAPPLVSRDLSHCLLGAIVLIGTSSSYAVCVDSMKRAEMNWPMQRQTCVHVVFGLNFLVEI